MAKKKKKASTIGRTYYIGQKDIGVVIITDRDQGVKIFRIPPEAIKKFAKDNDTLPDIVFAEIAKSLSFVSKMTDSKQPVSLSSQEQIDGVGDIAEAVQSNVLSSVPVNDADFCFITEVEEGDFSIGRYGLDVNILAGIFSELTSENIAPIGDITISNLSGSID